MPTPADGFYVGAGRGWTASVTQIERYNTLWFDTFKLLTHEIQGFTSGGFDYTRC